ncbi:MAG: hypothetical protein U0930_21075 [Pirellulales bacterium]
MNALSLLVCWTLLGQVGAPLGSNAPTGFGANSNSKKSSGSGFSGAGSGGAGFSGAGLSGTQTPSTPLGASSAQSGLPSSTGSAFTGNNSALNNNPNFNANAAFGGNSAALSSALDPSMDADNSRSYGWQIKDGELEYLIQVSPSMLRDMQSPPPYKSELQSHIPKELVGRIKRVVVSIGNEILPRTPSLIEVERLVPVAANLPPGRIQDLEGGAIVNVNNTSDNGFQSFNHSQASNPNLPSNLNQPAATTAPLGTMADQLRGNSGVAANNGSLLDRMQSSGTGISSGRLAGSTSATGRLGGASTGSFANNQNYSPNNGSYVQDQSVMQSGSGFASQNNYNNAGNYAPLRNDVNGNRLASNSTGIGNGFGASYNQYGTNGQDDSRRFAGTQADYQGLPAASGYLASNGQQRVEYPGTTLGTDRNLNARSIVPARDGSLVTNPNYLPQAYATQENNYFFYVFFILSIAVNLWMVHLLRSLYMRYRNLLSSLRSQSTTVG